jgi:hypothetical protein
MMSDFRWPLLILLLLMSPRTGSSEAFPIGDLLNDSLREGDTWVYHKSQYGAIDITYGEGYVTIKVDSIRIASESSVVFFSDRYFTDSHGNDYQSPVWFISEPAWDHWRSVEPFDFVQCSINADTLVRKESKVSDDSTIEWSSIDNPETPSSLFGFSKRYMKGYGLIYYHSTYNSFNVGMHHSSLTLELIEFNGRAFKYVDYKNIMDNPNSVKKRNKIVYKASQGFRCDILGRKVANTRTFRSRSLNK